MAPPAMHMGLSRWACGLVRRPIVEKHGSKRKEASDGDRPSAGRVGRSQGESAPAHKAPARGVGTIESAAEPASLFSEPSLPVARPLPSAAPGPRGHLRRVHFPLVRLQVRIRQHVLKHHAVELRARPGQVGHQVDVHFVARVLQPAERRRHLAQAKRKGVRGGA